MKDKAPKEDCRFDSEWDSAYCSVHGTNNPICREPSEDEQAAWDKLHEEYGNLGGLL